MIHEPAYAPAFSQSAPRPRTSAQTQGIPDRLPRLGVSLLDSDRRLGRGGARASDRRHVRSLEFASTERLVDPNTPESRGEIVRRGRIARVSNLDADTSRIWQGSSVEGITKRGAGIEAGPAFKHVGDNNQTAQYIGVFCRTVNRGRVSIEARWLAIDRLLALRGCERR